MGAQLKENEDFKAALAEQEMKRKIKENTGFAESAMDERSNSHSSYTSQSNFTALRSTRNRDNSQMDTSMAGRSNSFMPQGGLSGMMSSQ